MRPRARAPRAPRPRALQCSLALAVPLAGLCCGAAGAGERESLSARYADVAQQIVDSVREGNNAFRKLEELCDGIGHRLSGSAALDKAIDWAIESLKRDGHENVHREEVLVPKWTRGDESLVMITPRPMNIPMLGLGGSVGTPPEGITAEVLAVCDEADLTARAAEAAGKIVLFDFPMPREDERHGAGYDVAVRYRYAGAALASEHGAVAALVRSVTTRSLQSPHTGGMGYGDAERRIPAAAVSTEFASMISRLQARGVPVKLTLKMQARMHPEKVPSANVIAELRGTQKPDEIVIISGHLDSWDVGQGAHDDGGGCVMAMEALHVLRKLSLRPARTIRVILWTNEENGSAGGRTYAAEHADELARHIAAIEADSGSFAPIGYGVDMEDEARRATAIRQLKEIFELLRPVGKLTAEPGYGGADIRHMKLAGVPLLGHEVDMTHYFDIHHTWSDTLDKVEPAELSDNVAVLAVTAYVLADMEQRFAETQTD